jgi:hypothetical protein
VGADQVPMIEQTLGDIVRRFYRLYGLHPSWRPRRVVAENLALCPASTADRR